MQHYKLQDFIPLSEKDFLTQDFYSDEEIHFDIEYESDFRSAKTLRELVDKVCKSFGVPPKWRTRLVLIIDELNNNAIEYGSQAGQLNLFSLRLVKSENETYIDASVKDTGKGEHSKNAREMEELRDNHTHKNFSQHHSIRGRGLFLIIRQLVDTLYFKDSSDGGLIVGIQKQLKEENSQ